MDMELGIDKDIDTDMDTVSDTDMEKGHRHEHKLLWGTYYKKEEY